MTAAEGRVIGRCQHCGVKQFDNPNADPALGSIAHLCWKCAKPWKRRQVMITVSQSETVYRERQFTRAQVIDLMTDDIDSPAIPREQLEAMSDTELADALQEQANQGAEVYDSLSEGHYEPYEVDSSTSDFTVEAS